MSPEAVVKGKSVHTQFLSPNSWVGWSWSRLCWSANSRRPGISYLREKVSYSIYYFYIYLCLYMYMWVDSWLVGRKCPCVVEDFSCHVGFKLDGGVGFSRFLLASFRVACKSWVRPSIGRFTYTTRQLACSFRFFWTEFKRPSIGYFTSFTYPTVRTRNLLVQDPSLFCFRRDKKSPTLRGQISLPLCSPARAFWS